MEKLKRFITGTRDSYTKSMRVKLSVLFLVLSLVPLGVTTVYIYFGLEHFEDEVKDRQTISFKKISDSMNKTVPSIIKENIESDLTLVDERVSDLIHDSKTLTLKVKELNSLGVLESEYTEPLLKMIKEGTNTAQFLYFGSTSGNFLITPKTEGLPADYNPTKTDWYKNAINLKNGDFSITDSYQAADGTGLMITVSTPIFNGDKKLGVVAVDSVLSNLSDRIATVTVGKTGYIIVLDKNNTVIAHKDKSQIGKNFSDLDSVKTIGSESRVDTSKFFSLDKINKDTGWKIIAVQPNAEYSNIMKTLSNHTEKSKETLSAEISSTNKSIVTTVILVSVFLILVCTASGYILARRIAKPIKDMANVADKIANGELNTIVEVQTRDELGVLADAINRVVTSLKGVLTNITEISRSTEESSSILTKQVESSNTASETISQTMGEVAVASENLTTNMVSVSNVVDSISSTVNDYTGIINRVATEMSATKDITTSSLTSLDNVAKTMKGLEVQSVESSKIMTDLDRNLDDITQVTETIRGIAEQTNLLALNASIEAARAGEHGRGFAVVATEVRKLSEQSKSSVETISSLIDSIHRKSKDAVTTLDKGVTLTEEGSAVVSELATYFTAILEGVNNLTSEIESVLSRTNEINDGVMDINNSVQDVVAISEQTTASTEEVASSLESQTETNQKLLKVSKDLNDLTVSLEEQLSKFKLN